MDNEEPTKEKGRPRASVVSIMLAIVGIVLPLGAFVGVYPFIKHGRAMTGQELALAFLCSLLFLVLEFVALAYGLAARRTMLGKAAVGISGALMGLSSILFAFGLTICLDNENAGWLTGTPFWVIMVAVVLAVSLAFFGLFRAKRLS
jgi:hypothetical protein